MTPDAFTLWGMGLLGACAFVAFLLWLDRPMEDCWKTLKAIKAIAAVMWLALYLLSIKHVLLWAENRLNIREIQRLQGQVTAMERGR